MKKTLILVIAMVSGYIVLSANCNPPAGIPQTPSWIEGNEPITYEIDGINLCTGTICEVRIHWCYREVDGTCEILIGDIEMVDLLNEPGDERIELCWERWELIGELLIDRAVMEIAFTHAPCLYAHQIEPCDDNPTNDPYVTRVYEVKCRTEPQIDVVNGQMKEVRYACESSSYCEYEYYYCYEGGDADDPENYYSKELLMSTTVNCEPLLKSNRYISCFPEDCHTDRWHIPVPSKDQVAVAPTAEHYFLNYDEPLYSAP